jgi:hypothetical protein
MIDRMTNVSQFGSDPGDSQRSATLHEVGSNRVERRGSPRAKGTLKADIGYRDEQDLFPATTKDFSLSGICLRASFAAAPGDELLVLLSVGGRTAPATATVVKSENVDNDTVELRLKFSWLPNFSMRKLAGLTGVAPASGRATRTDAR